MKLKLIQLDNQRHKLTRGLLKGPPLRIRTRDEGMDGASGREREGEREREREREREGERFRWEPLKHGPTHMHGQASLTNILRLPAHRPGGGRGQQPRLRWVRSAAPRRLRSTTLLLSAAPTQLTSAITATGVGGAGPRRLGATLHEASGKFPRKSLSFGP